MVNDIMHNLKFQESIWYQNINLQEENIFMKYDDAASKYM